MKIRFAATPEERHSAFRLRYQIYVQEMNIFRDRADHQRKILEEDEDQRARLLIASKGGEAIASMRLTWGGDGAFSEEMRSTYSLERFGGLVAPEQITIATRFMVFEDYRNTAVPFRMIVEAIKFGVRKDIVLGFCDCQPHLIGLYQRFGFRPYRQTYNDPGFGIMIPLVLVLGDLEYLRRIGSPLVKLMRGKGAGQEEASRLLELMPNPLSVQSAASATLRQFLAEVSALVEGDDWTIGGIFEGLAAEQVRKLLSKSHIIECCCGDNVIRSGQITRTMFVVLSGTLEARVDGRTVGYLSKGNVFGEVAFLTASRRMADVYAVSGAVRVLALNEQIVRKFIDEDEGLAAKLLLNLAKALCLKLQKTEY